MALPDRDALKRILKIEHTAEDTLVDEIRGRALGLIQKYIGCPVAATERTFYDEAESQVVGRSPRSLLIPETPIDVDSVTISDRDGTALDMTLLRVNPETGIVRYTDGETRFPFGAYEITCDVGLDTLDTYEAEVEPVVAQALVDTVADLYFRRSPAALSESSSGVVRAYQMAGASGLPQRVQDALNAIRRPL